MKRFVALRGDRERALGWSGSCSEGVLHAPEGDAVLEAEFTGESCLLKLDGRVFRVEWTSAGRLRVNGREVAVKLRSELEHRFAGLVGAGEEDLGKRMTVPMPGRVVQVLVAPGDEVRKGQGLVIVEAMKMENELKAVRAGRIAAVHVTPGSSVEKGALLLELE